MSNRLYSDFDYLVYGVPYVPLSIDPIIIKASGVAPCAFALLSMPSKIKLLQTKMWRKMRTEENRGEERT